MLGNQAGCAQYRSNVSMQVGGNEYKAFESPWPFRPDPELDAWRQRLRTRPSSEVSIREATAVPQDGRRVWDLQVECEPIYVRSVRENVSMIAERVVLLAEIDKVHVGFCVSFPGYAASDPLFIRIVAVAPAVQRRGVGLALLTAAAERELGRNLALATQDTNIAARALNERFANSIGASIRRVPLGTYSDRDLGIRRGDDYRAWVVRRKSSTI